MEKPWCLDHLPQGDVSVAKAILNEALRYSEWYEECQFSLVVAVPAAIAPGQLQEFLTAVSLQTWQNYGVKLGLSAGAAPEVIELIEAAQKRNPRLKCTPAGDEKK